MTGKPDEAPRPHKHAPGDLIEHEYADPAGRPVVQVMKVHRVEGDHVFAYPAPAEPECAQFHHSQVRPHTPGR